MKKDHLSLISLLILFTFCCDKNDAQTKAEPQKQDAKVVQNNPAKKDSTKTKITKVTFIELGSVSCIPCRMMQPVMKAVEEDFSDQIKVIFYDVWKDAAPGKKYGIRVIPTQVFLDESGKEFFRHEGYFPKEEIDKLLIDKGLKKKDQTKPKKS